MMKTTNIYGISPTSSFIRFLAIAGATLTAGTSTVALAQANLAAIAPAVELDQPAGQQGRETVDMSDCPSGIPAWAQPFLEFSVYPVIDGYLRWDPNGGAYCDNEDGKVIISYDPIYGEAIDAEGRREVIDPLHCVLEQEKRHYFEDQHGFDGDELYQFSHELLSNPRTRERFFPATESLHTLTTLAEGELATILVHTNYRNCLHNGRPVGKPKQKVIEIYGKGEFPKGCVIRFEDSRKMECDDDNIDRSGGEG